MKMDLIITIVNRGFADSVMDAARSKGASGGTIITGRGTLKDNVEKFFNITVSPEKELVLTVVDTTLRHDIMEEIRDKVGLATDGGGVAFSLPIEEFVGFNK